MNSHLARFSLRSTPIARRRLFWDASRTSMLAAACVLVLSGCALAPYAQAAAALLVALAAAILAACGGGGGAAGGNGGPGDGGESSIVAWPDEIDVGDLDATTGFILEGRNSADLLGFSVAAGIDVNGDGRADMIVGAPGANGYYLEPSYTFMLSEAGTAHVIFGDSDIGQNLFADQIPTELFGGSGSPGIVLSGRQSGAQVGYTVALAKDVNGDGLGDIVVGQPIYSAGEGRGWVIFGDTMLGSIKGSARWVLSINFYLEEPDYLGGEGFLVHNPSTYEGQLAQTRLGFSAAVLDLNGDGLSDISFGAPGTQYVSDAYWIMPKAVTLFGRADVAPYGANIEVPAFSAPYEGTSFGGATGDVGDWRYYAGIGQSLAGGNVNGDGFEDLVIGMRRGFYYSSGYPLGGAVVVFGGDTGVFPTEFDYFGGNSGITALIGEPAGIGQYYFSEVAFLGDVNNDGLGDIGITVPLRNRAYVVFGRSQMPASLDRVQLGSLDGSDGFRIDFPANYGGSGQYSQEPQALAGHDINGDGIDDVVVGVGAANGKYTRVLGHVIFGRSDLGSTGSIDLSTSLAHPDGFSVAFASPDGIHSDVSLAIGDVNADDLPDLIVGAAQDNYAGQRGRVYIIFSPGPNSQ